MKQKSIDSLLVLNFLYELLYKDYRGYINEEDYHTIERALNCLYGTNCLIPYPDYQKMGKLCLGSTTELAQRIDDIEKNGAGYTDLKALERRVKKIEDADLLAITEGSTDDDISVSASIEED